MHKKIFIITLTAALSLAAATTAFAGTWQKGISRPNDWWYDNGDGTWAANGWHWIDGNNDGIAECYYFDHEGWMAANTTTPDGYQVNANGAWVQNGAVQTKSVGVQAQTSASTSTNINTVQALDGVTFSQGAYGWRLDYAAYSDGRTFYLKEDGTKAAPGESFVWQGEMYTIGSDWMSERPLAGYGKSNTSSITSSSSASSSSGSSASYEEVDIDEFIDEVVRLINKERRRAGVQELDTDGRLMEAAAVRAEELQERFSHLRPDGTLAETAAREAGFNSQMNSSTRAVENITGPVNTPEHAVECFYTSTKGHKERMLQDDWTVIGVGADQLASGQFNVVVFYGRGGD